jgi:hypothetical protein
LRGERQGGWKREGFIIVKTNATFAVRSSAQRQSVSAVVAWDRLPAAGGCTPPFSGPAVACFGDWRGSWGQVGGAGRLMNEGLARLLWVLVERPEGLQERRRAWLN